MKKAAHAVVDQLTAQAAQNSDQPDLAKELQEITRQRDQFRADSENLRHELSAAHEQTMRAQQAEAQVKDLTKQLEESKQREEQLRDQVAKVEPNTETGSLQKIKSAAAAANSEPDEKSMMR